jgi:hypothetical protein
MGFNGDSNVLGSPKTFGASFAAKETALISAERSVGMSLVRNEARTGIVAKAQAQEVLQSVRSSSSEYVNLASKFSLGRKRRSLKLLLLF